ncbi:MAG: ATP-grasp domain-containing protein [Lachnospiraceae bacterium]|jgi:D-alanine--(R)-lactate ligase|nr:ATP-grasp domain-containing protein [Lachnospiraceae bacterium]
MDNTILSSIGSSDTSIGNTDASYPSFSDTDLSNRSISNRPSHNPAANRRKIAILFGGRSEEHDVSIKSAQEIAAHIDREQYDPIYIGITRSGNWKRCATPCPEWETNGGPTVFIAPDRATHGLILLSEQDGEHKVETCYIDVVFPVLHGKMGEDGTIQGLLELSGIPYVGCALPASVLCMDKALAHMTVRSAGINTPFCCIYDRGQNSDNIDNIRASDIDVTATDAVVTDNFVNIDSVTNNVTATNIDPKSRSLDYPVFVKPARSGSSFGITKVNDEEGLAAAIALAEQYDHKVIIEGAITGIEVGCAVLGNDGELTVGEVDQITLSHGFFRIHQEKQPENGSENAVVTVPAHLPADQRLLIQETAKAIYRALGCRGLARVDMFLQADGTIVLNEVNTLPGFTAYSRYPRMMAAAGIGLTELIDRLVALALEGSAGLQTM